MERVGHTPELLDGPLDDAAVLQGNLRDLRRINRLLGGAGLSRAAALRLLESSPRPGSSLIDVGTGAADIALALHRLPPPLGPLSVVAVDNRPEVLAAARALDPSLDHEGGVQLVLGDGRRLPFTDAAFDVGHTSLVLHHLEPVDAVAFLSELRRVSRIGIVVNDLLRGGVFWALAWVGGRVLTGNRFTRHDAPLSVRRAYTLPEIHELLAAAGLRAIHVRHGVLGHRVAIAALPHPP